ncbi:hypothetical protein MNEG_7702 [Monoraphidium neglectum]|uniref:Methyltransferase FkbM domain-containing protein n=1 Tax=Monoraphidium neglectum TaxID=145388 RepID=A0A0D2KYG4_9CHLO|nr:hypothetical protein MNEG_7702 [Monoraphidium neglectum]KIZ00259.1 hypothetical protein MNEG_7702 [Monoraphidium neglectum]|eukprot:XP_013899278.1 hypothetical protein MNEG_7702 [Monoraphidium neglectum]
MSVMRLDSLVEEDVQFMKIDVEGFESEVLKGASGLLQNFNVFYIIAECNIGILGLERAKKFLRFLSEFGYAISGSSFQGPFLDDAAISRGSAPLGPGENLYLVKRELLRAQPRG